MASIIAAKYALSPRLSGADVRVDVDAGIVTLRGSVRDLRARRAAGALARDTAGVKTVRNRLVVRSMEAVRPDDDVRGAGEQALQRDAMTQGANVSVRVNAGTVELRGEVNSALARIAAEDVVAGVRGVNGIDNDLVVDPEAAHYALNPFVDDWTDAIPDDDPQRFRHDGTATVTRRSDGQIEAEIRRQLWWSAFVDQEDIELAVDDGVATLTGVVGTRAEVSAAVQNALQGGATSVINEIQVAE
jgi:osmotically-inducible protein OsmY